MSRPVLALEHVYVSRGAAPVLHDIHLTLQQGEHLAILGPNGCGKSSLLKTITCKLYPLAVGPDGSRPLVSIFGRQRWDVSELRRRLGVVSPDLPGKPILHISGMNAILTGFFSSSTLWPNLSVTDAMRSRAKRLIERVGAAHLSDKPVGEMSAGEQRRIMIARALAGSGSAVVPDEGKASAEVPASPHPVTTTPDVPGGPAEILLLDEPSNALDLAAQQELRTLLRQLAREGVTILLITHHIADIVPEIDRVLLMHSGRILLDGSKQQLLTSDRLSALFGVPVDVSVRDGFFHAW